jgi:hypothetical protein
VLAMPVHFANRARLAEAGGRYDEANCYAMLAGLLEDLFDGTTLRDAATPHPPQQPEAERSAIVADASPSAMSTLTTLDPASNDRAGDRQPNPASTTSLTALTPTPGRPPAELAGRAGDRGGVAPGPTPAIARLPPANAAEESAKRQLAVSDESKLPREPERRVALREIPSTPAGTDARSPSGELLTSPKPSVSARGGTKIATGPPPPRLAAPASTKVATSTVNTLDPRCRAIVLKFQIGEEPSDAERNLLRHGCRQHG